MTKRSYRVVKNHSRTRISHHLTNALTHLWFVAVNFTLRAKTLLCHKWALQGALVGILGKLSALVAKLFCAVVIATVESNHISHDLSLVL
jgi:hypothetical protein